MEALRLSRKIGRIETSREVGSPYGLPRIIKDQAIVALTIGEMSTFPTISVPSPVITDPGDTNFGKFRFILGISRMGGPDVMG